jgi:hypothetical protein
MVSDPDTWRQKHPRLVEAALKAPQEKMPDVDDDAMSLDMESSSRGAWGTRAPNQRFCMVLWSCRACCTTWGEPSESQQPQTPNHTLNRLQRITPGTGDS